MAMMAALALCIFSHMLHVCLVICYSAVRTSEITSLPNGLLCVKWDINPYSQTLGKQDPTSDT